MGDTPLPRPELSVAETRVAWIEPRDEPIREVNLWLRSQAGRRSLGCRAGRPSSDLSRPPVRLATRGHPRFNPANLWTDPSRPVPNPMRRLGPQEWASSIVIFDPSLTLRSTVGSPTTFPKTLTGLAALGLSSWLAGVLPKKMQKA